MLARLRDEQFWLLTGGVLLLAFVGVSFALHFTRSFMIPFVFSIFLTAMVSPIDNLLVVRYHLSRWVGLVASLLTIILLAFVIFFFMRFAIYSMTDMTRKFGVTADQIIEKIDGIVQYTGLPLEAMARYTGVEPTAVIHDPASTEDVDSGVIGQMGTQEDSRNYDYLRVLFDPIKQEVPRLLNLLATTFKNFITSGTLVLLFCLFILMGRDPHSRSKNEIYREVERSVQKYLNIKFFISFLTGTLVYITFACLGLPMAFLFGICAFVLNFIPSIGSIVATFLPLPIALIAPEFTPWKIFLAFFIPCIIQNLLGNIIEPRLQGKGLKLHPVTILLALGYFGVIWGPVGMLLAAPLTAALRIIMLEFDMTKWIARLMGGRLPQFERTLEVDSDD